MSAADGTTTTVPANGLTTAAWRTRATVAAWVACELGNDAWPGTSIGGISSGQSCEGRGLFGDPNGSMHEEEGGRMRRLAERQRAAEIRDEAVLLRQGFGQDIRPELDCLEQVRPLDDSARGTDGGGQHQVQGRLLGAGSQRPFLGKLCQQDD